MANENQDIYGEEDIQPVVHQEGDEFQVLAMEIQPIFPEPEPFEVDLQFNSIEHFQQLLYQFIRDAGWARRKNFVMMAYGSGYRLLATQQNIQQALALQNPHAKLPTIDRSTAETNMAYLFGQVFSNEGLFRRIAKMM